MSLLLEMDEELLYEAVEGGDIQLVTRFLDLGVDINGRYMYGDTLLIKACRNNQKEMVEFLLTKSADVNGTNSGRWTGLMWAAWNGFGDIVNILLKTKDINVMEGDKVGRTAIHLAAANNHVTIVERLLSCSVPVDINDNGGHTPLWWAVAYHGRVCCVDVLLKHGASPQHESKYGGSPLEIAKRKGYSDVVEMMEEAIRFTSHRYVKGHVSAVRRQDQHKIRELESEVEEKDEEISCLRMSGADRVGAGRDETWLSSQPAGDVMHAVAALACDQWNEVGLELEYEMPQLNSITSSIAAPSSKLLAILRTKALAVGTGKVVGIILSACRRISMPICAAAIRDEVVRRQERLKARNGGQ